MATARFASVVIVALALCACSGPQQPAPQATPATGSVWVADERADSLSVIDAATNSVAMTITGLIAPHNVQVGDSGSVVYATSGKGIVVAIDPASYRIIAVAPTGPHPAHVIESPGGKVYVTNAGNGTVSVYQARGLVPAGLITLGGMPHGMRPAAGGSVIVVANMMAGALDLIDPVTDTPVGEIPVGTSPVQVAVSADGRYAYTGISDPPSVVKVDLVQKKVLTSAPVPASSVQLYLTPDEKTVLSADQGSEASPGHTLSVIATETMETRASVPTGSGPHGVVIDTSGTHAWVTNSYDDTVSVVDLVDMSVSHTIAVAFGPNGISYSPRAPVATAGNVTAVVVPEQSGHSDHH